MFFVDEASREGKVAFMKATKCYGQQNKALILPIIGRFSLLNHKIMFHLFKNNNKQTNTEELGPPSMWARRAKKC